MNLKNIRCKTQLFSEFRTELMGIATIMILLCHARPNGVTLPDSLLYLLGLGQYGVNIFFFLSGFGIYYSLNYSKNIYLWYKKRLIRIFIPYLLIILPILFSCEEYLSLKNILLRASTIGYWTGLKNVSWFVAVLISFYIVSPLIKKILDYFTKCYYIVLVLLWCGSSYLCSLLLYYDDNLITKHLIQTFQSFPSFLLGMWLSPYIKSSEGISIFELLGGGIILSILSLIEYFLTGIKSYWLLFLLLLWIVSSNLKKVPKLCSLLAFFGTISLESYLFNTNLPLIFKGNGNWYYLY